MLIYQIRAVILALCNAGDLMRSPEAVTCLSSPSGLGRYITGNCKAIAIRSEIPDHAGHNR